MAESIQVRNIQILTDLKLGFSQFSSRTERTLFSVETELRRTLDWIHEEVAEKRRIVSYQRAEVEHALEALRSCRASGDEDYEPDCSAEEETLEEAQRELANAENNLEITQRIQRQIEIAVEEHRKQVYRVKRLILFKAIEAQNILTQKVIDLEKYLSVVTPSSASSGDLVSKTTETNIATTSADPSNNTISVIPSENMFAKWAEAPVQSVEVSMLPEIDDIHGPEDFQKVSVKEMEAGFEKLKEIMPMVELGAGTSSEFWRQKDQELGFVYENGYQKIYEVFYGSGAIKVAKYNNNYDIISGRHRIWLARKLGINTLPIKILDYT
jgi:hypothetical protein